MSHKSKKQNRRKNLNLLLNACHGLLDKAREHGVSMNSLRKMFPQSFFTGKRYRNGTPGAFGPSAQFQAPPSFSMPKQNYPCAGNSHDRRKKRRALSISSAA